MTAWLAAHGWWIAIVSIAAMILSAPLGLKVVVGLPADYLSAPSPVGVLAQSPSRPLIYRIAKNAAGIVVLLLGLLMSFPLVPGPGILLLLVGLMLTDLPGKRAMERRLLGNAWVLKEVNRLRRRRGKPAIRPPARET